MEVEAPDGPAALELERRLWHLHSTSVFRDRRWLVEVDDPPAVEEIEPIVERWLADMGERVTTVRLADRELRVECPHRRR